MAHDTPPDWKKRPTRRRFIKGAGSGMGLVWLSPAILPAMSCGDDTSAGGGMGGAGGTAGTGGTGGTPANLVSNIANLGPLGDADANGVQLPAGFTSRIVARSGQAPADGASLWHNAPDGGDTYATDDGGWIYVSNSETVPGGVSSLRFAADGTVTDAYNILTGTIINCAGGKTPWGTWLSCEEVLAGRVWECDPLGGSEGQVRPALGTFCHEAVAVDMARMQLYLTEDEGDGLLYRFTSAGMMGDRLDLDNGLLEAAAWNDMTGEVSWLEVPDPTNSSDGGTRNRVPGATRFDGGEGIWFHQDRVYFSTKGDDRIWDYDAAAGSLSILYDRDTSDTPILSGVDNIVVSDDGDVIVAEDGGNMELVALPPGGMPVAIARVVGQDGSEITGPAFSPDRTRLYFSSQRGESGDIGGNDGITYEITGPFFIEET